MRGRRRLGPIHAAALVLAFGSPAPARADTKALTLESPAPGLYVHRGAQAEPGPGNDGDIANIGFIVGDRCVAVIDTGGSRKVGAALLAAIRGTTGKPVCHVINTHVHPDHSFGDAAFAGADPGLEFVAHAEFAAARAARRDHYRASLERALGEAAAGSEIAVPDRAIRGEQTLDLGNRVLRLKAWPTAHTNHDLSVYDERSGTLWTGDLLSVDRLPAMDGRVLGWLAVLDEIAALKPARVIPGHGPLDRPPLQAIAAERAYLQGLVDDCRAALRDGATLSETVDQLGARRQPQWALFDQYHRRNVTAVYTELEWEDGP